MATRVGQRYPKARNRAGSGHEAGEYRQLRALASTPGDGGVKLGVMRFGGPMRVLETIIRLLQCQLLQKWPAR